MLSLENWSLHMRGQAVRVNGNRYEVDMKCRIHDVKPEDAEKLLLGDAWSVVTEQPDDSESGLLDDEGEPISEGGGEAELKDLDESMSIEELKARADGLDVSYGANIGKALLIERIEEAMAEDD